MARWLIQVLEGSSWKRRRFWPRTWNIPLFLRQALTWRLAHISRELDGVFQKMEVVAKSWTKIKMPRGQDAKPLLTPNLCRVWKAHPNALQSRLASLVSILIYIIAGWYVSSSRMRDAKERSRPNKIVRPDEFQSQDLELKYIPGDAPTHILADSYPWILHFSSSALPRWCRQEPKKMLQGWIPSQGPMKVYWSS